MPLTLILANVLAPYVAWGVGDDVGLSLPFSMLATTLAAMVERPFYKAAGIRDLNFRYAMQANILSWFVGLTIAYVSLILRLEAIFFVMCIIAVPFSIAIEGSYLSGISSQNDLTKLKWTPVVAGNVVSGLLLFAIKLFGFQAGAQMQQSGSSLVLFLKQYSAIMHWGIGIGCLLLFCFCCWPRLQPKSVNPQTGVEHLPITEDAK